MLGQVQLHPASTADAIDQLRSFIVAEHGAVTAHDLERHLARPRRQDGYTRLATLNGAIIGYALIGHRRHRLGAATIEAGAIEQIYLQEARRGHGIFRSLVGDCMRVLLENHLPLATVQGVPSLFARFGFAPYLFSSAVEGWQAPAGAHTLRAVVPGDLEDLAALRASCYAAVPLAEDRAAPDWRFWLAGAPEALALEDSRGRVIGYAALERLRVERQIQVTEAAAADAGAARALLGALAAARTAAEEWIVLALPPAHVVAQAALHLGGSARLSALSAAPRRSSLAMAGVIDLPGMLEALTPAFDERLSRSRYAGWSGNLRVEIETERVTLAVEQGRAAVIDGSRPADVRLRRVTLPALAQLCLGFRAAADLRATGGLDCDDSALGLIDALFPVEL